jgi:hypothetical protein
MCFRLMKGGPNADIYVIFQMSASSPGQLRICRISSRSGDPCRAHKQEWLVEILYGNYGRAEVDPEVRSHNPKARIKGLRELQDSLKQVSVRAN